MYIPTHFHITDKDEIHAFIEANAFGQLISSVDGQLFSTHMPFLFSADRSTLLGHLAKPNPQCNVLDNQQVMISLAGPHQYVSPSWYASPGVPTWNYQAAHIYGRCALFTDTEKIKTVVDALTEKYEAAFASPWQPHYQHTMLSAIIGIEIVIDDIQCKYKLNQNRSSKDQESVAGQFEKSGALTLARAMRKNLA
jgi:transcriptional regulator